MSSIESYQYDIRRYSELRTKVNTIISKLNLAADSVGDIDFEIKSSYQVDGGNANVAYRTTNLENEMRDTASFLRDTIIPSIDSSMADTRRQIEYLEEEERRRQEEEEQRRKEEEEKNK